MGMKNKYFKECYLEKIFHYDALEVWDELKIGKHLSLGFDDNKVILKYSNESILGELNTDDSKFIIDLVKQGWEEVFGVTISSIVEDASEDKRIKVVIYIKEGPQKKSPKYIAQEHFSSKILLHVGK